MFNSIKSSIQQAFFDSLEKAGCLSLETENPDSSDEEKDEALDDEVEDSEDESDEGTDDEEEESDEEDVCGADREGVSLVSGDELLHTKVMGFGSFLRKNPRTDKFPVERIHHVDIWCPDATNTAMRFSWALGMPVVAKSDLSTGNNIFTSYVLKCGEILLCFTAPQSSYSAAAPPIHPRIPFPGFKAEQARAFINNHGLAVRAVAVEVADVAAAYHVSINNGAKGVTELARVVDSTNGSSCWQAEVALMGNVVLRFIQTSGDLHTFLPNFSPASTNVLSYGLCRIDHILGAVSNLQETLQYIKTFTGFHEFKEEEDEEEAQTSGGKEYSVLANNSESVLLPIISPRQGQQVQSRVNTFLQSNSGPGIQHIAVTCADIVQTVQEMRARSDLGGLHFYPRPPAKYYKELKTRLGSKLSQQQLDRYRELGILVDLDDRGILLQILTRPVCDRHTLSFELVQRISHQGASFPIVGCGGFGVNHVKSLEVDVP